MVDQWEKIPSLMKADILIKQVDSKGRVTLGESFANQAVLIESHGEGEVLVKVARVIPAKEAWLYENKAALASVRRGLKQASEREFVQGPDLTKASRLAERLKDE